MLELTLHLPVAVGVVLGLLGAVLIYRDAQKWRMESPDLWASGFFIAFLALPIVGGLIVLVFYFQKRNRNGPRPHTIPRR